MTVLFRSFLVWLMLLALPYQGYASAQMLLCVVPAPAQEAHAAMNMPAGPHDHAAMLAAQAAHQHDGDQSSSHSNMKCTGSACCAAAAPLLTLDLSAPASPLASRMVPFYSDFLPAVDLAHPERPPQGRDA
ncbi:hypothetical protein GJ699_02210 [Duganella sp. FT80W]|uniref:DUF2946 domain-containing protein n=1 Tax=Duganella guangzhouensis TaxID=2666084 RepID=A0A6I2KSI9_9BURK|nr:hypothetical protein [Duganella guangzhouensis]MRW88795.1 hypothetical protein [Duganella guangzhouensis]